MERHIHCKKCGEVMIQPILFTVSYVFEIENYNLKICKSCLEKIGIETIKKENKKKSKVIEGDVKELI